MCCHYPYPWEFHWMVALMLVTRIYNLMHHHLGVCLPLDHTIPLVIDPPDHVIQLLVCHNVSDLQVSDLQ